MKLSNFFILFNALVLVMLGGSIFLNFLLYDQAKKYYFELNETRLDPVGLSYYPVEKDVPAGRQFRVVFFGDSRAASWIPPEMDGYEFINRGIPSQTSTQVIQRFPYHMRSLNPDVIVIQVGINDLKTVALFPERRESIVANSQANIKRMVEASRSLGAIVVLTTVFPAGEVPLARKPFWSDDVGQAVQEVNAYIATLADEQIIVFDTFSLLSDNQGVMLQDYRMDELHLNAKGYAVLNEALAKLITTIHK